MKIIDSHTHLYGEDFEKDLPDVIQRAQGKGVCKMLLPNVDYDSVDDLFKSVEQYPDILIPMMGLHPCSVSKAYKEQLNTIKEIYDSKPKSFFCAIGEVGLDYYWDTSLKSEQQNAFAEQVEWSVREHLPLSMHTRDAVMDAIAIYNEAGANKAEGVFHSFTGTEQELIEIERKTNSYVGINGVLTFKNSDLKSFLSKRIPLSRILLETDAPYLAPVPNRGKRNEPSFLVNILEFLSDVYQQPIDVVADQVYHNTLSLYRRIQND